MWALYGAKEIPGNKQKIKFLLIFTVLIYRHISQPGLYIYIYIYIYELGIRNLIRKTSILLIFFTV